VVAFFGGLRPEAARARGSEGGGDEGKRYHTSVVSRHQPLAATAVRVHGSRDRARPKTHHTMYHNRSLPFFHCAASRRPKIYSQTKQTKHSKGKKTTIGRARVVSPAAEFNETATALDPLPTPLRHHPVAAFRTDARHGTGRLKPSSSEQRVACLQGSPIVFLLDFRGVGVSSLTGLAGPRIRFEQENLRQRGPKI